MPRIARAGDLDGLLALYRQLNPGDPILPAAVAERAWAAMRSAPGITVFVAERGGMLAATCTLVVVPNLTRGARPYALVENVVTDAGHRRAGLGRAVIGAAIAHAWEQGCYKAMLLTGSKDPATLRFYAGIGFTQDKTGFQIRRG